MSGNIELHKSIYSKAHQKDANGIQSQKLSSLKHTEILDVNILLAFISSYQMVGKSELLPGT